MESKLIVQDTISAATIQTLAGARAALLGANLSRKAGLHVVSTCATDGDALALPKADGEDMTNSLKVIRNQTANYCQVFPDTGGFIECLKGSLAVNAAYILHPRCVVKLQCTDNLNWRVISESGHKTRNIDAATTLSVADDGATVAITAGAAYTINLPLATAGCKFKFVLEANGNNVAITSPAANMRGILLNAVAADNVIAVTKTAGGADATVNILAAAIVGTLTDIVSDGIFYSCSGVGSGVTFS